MTVRSWSKWHPKLCSSRQEVERRDLNVSTYEDLFSESRFPENHPGITGGNKASAIAVQKRTEDYFSRSDGTRHLTELTAHVRVYR